MTTWLDPDSRPVNEHGSKAQIGVGGGDYSAWRRTIGNRCYASDVDWIEWRTLGGNLVPVAVIEITFYTDIPAWRHKLPTYRTAILDRFKRDAQYGCTMRLACALNALPYLVVARKDLAWFMVCSLMTESWHATDESGYRKWIEGLYMEWISSAAKKQKEL